VNQLCGFYTSEEGTTEESSFTKLFTPHSCASPDLDFRNINLIDSPAIVEDYLSGTMTGEAILEAVRR